VRSGPQTRRLSSRPLRRVPSGLPPQPLALSGRCRYKISMANQRDPASVDASRAKGEYLEVRLSLDEKRAFKDAADFAGLALSAWVRERLRRAAREELERAGRQVAFLPRRGGS
jgi:hypothetical protein